LVFAARAQPLEVRMKEDRLDPTPKDVSDNYQALSVTRSAGGHRLDHCELRFDLAAAGEHLEDVETPTNQSTRVQIHLVDPAGGDSLGCLFSGELGTSAIRIDRAESQNATARIEPWHFGDVLLGPKVLDIDNATILTPDHPIIFQPEIDGRIEDNRLFMLNITATEDADNYSLWINPEAARTGTAMEATGHLPLEWTLAYAVHSLCWACNPDETFIANPTLKELQAIFEPPGDTVDQSGDEAVDDAEAEAADQTDETADQADGEETEAEAEADQTLHEEQATNQSPVLRNVHLPRGKRLPELLDLLLPRFGYNWFIEPVLEETDSSGASLDPPVVTNHIRVFQLGAGEEVKLYLQPITNPPTSLNSALSNVPDIEAEWNWADVANEIIGQGSLNEFEATFELYRGWPDEDEEFTADQLRKVDDGADDSDDESVFKEHPNAWRKWVLNEAGDYCNTRIAFATIPDKPFDLKPLLGPNAEAKRRRFHHCLTKSLDGERREVYLQYRDPTVSSDSDPAAWKTIPREGADAWVNAGFHVLEKECGIYFSGATPPDALMEIDDPARGGTAGAARLRITACLRGDDRLQYIAVTENLSPNGNTIQLFVDLSDRFHFRQIQDLDIPGTGPYPTIYKSALLGEKYGDDTVNDLDLLTHYCETLRTLEQAARLSCEFEVAGIQTGYQIGQLVTAINGRNISFNRNSVEQAEKLYPQITSITFDRQKQRTKLRVENFDFTPGKLRKLSL
jgi:hypothetical protein